MSKEATDNFTSKNIDPQQALSDKVVGTSTGETDESIEYAVRKKLIALYTLQKVDSQADKIRNIRGELPLEVQDLEDEIAGLETRIQKFVEEIKELDIDINERKTQIKESKELIKKYEAQQMNVRNNREYDSLTKEVEFQNLEIQVCEKKIKEYTANIEFKVQLKDKSEEELKERLGDLEVKKAELDDIVEETQRDEQALIDKSKEMEGKIEERLLKAYKRIRNSFRNGLSVVPIERDACGGCFNRIPPQRQLDIKMHKKIIVCEYCGRILIDDEIVSSVNIEF